FLPSLMKDRNLEDVQIRLTLISTQSAFDFIRTQEMLKKLPKIDKLRVDWTARTSSKDQITSDECLIDDESLLHIVSQTNHAELDKGECTAQGILRAFEMVCESPIVSKFVSFDAQKQQINELFSFANWKFDKIESGSGRSKELIHRETRTSLTARFHDTYYSVEMYKFDKDFSVLAKVVKW
ncbi:hypothetical protein PMAYCL1PPCAC_31085, partial [Pristionchus mayeri]